MREERWAIVEAGRPVQGAPDLVVEVLSPTTRAKDLPDSEKWDAYRRYGVPAYWIVDPDARTVTQYVHRDGAFVEVAACGRAARRPGRPSRG